MKLKSIDFGTHVFGQSGVQGFFGEGDEYPHHKFFKLIPGFSFHGMCFVAKTATVLPRIYPHSSNTELVDGYRLKKMFPESVWWSLTSIIKGYVVNAVGLAGPGARALFEYNKWQRRTDVFQLSFMPLASTLEGKLDEARLFALMVNEHMPYHRRHQYGIQVNLSCPNTGHNQEQDPSEAIEILKVLRQHLPEIPLIPKFDLFVEPQTIVALKPYCDAFCISNTVEVGRSEKIPWTDLFANGVSPMLRHFGGRFKGGLSGAPLFPLLIDWLKKMEAVDHQVAIIAGGGIMTKDNIRTLAQFSSVRGVALGSVAILRPWRVQGLINYANKIFSHR